MEELAGGSYGELQAKIDQIPAPEVREALHEAFQQAAQSAYEPIYWTTAVMALLMIIISIMFSKQFNQDAIESDKLDAQEKHLTAPGKK